MLLTSTNAAARLACSSTERLMELGPVRKAAKNTPSSAMREITRGPTMIIPATEVSVPSPMAIRISSSSDGPPMAFAAIDATLGLAKISGAGVAVRKTMFSSRYKTVTSTVPRISERGIVRSGLDTSDAA